MNTITHIQNMFKQLQSVAQAPHSNSPIVQALNDQNQRNGLWLTKAPCPATTLDPERLDTTNDFGVGMPPMSTPFAC